MKIQTVLRCSLQTLIKNALLVALLIALGAVSESRFHISEAQEQTETRNTLQPPWVESQLEELKKTLYCYCGCERETIEVCVCGTAQMIETDFRDRLNAGETAEQIRTNYLETHGPQFYAVMPAKGINLLAYIMPAVILIVIGGVAFTVLRKSRQVGEISESRYHTDRYGQAASQVSDETVKKVEAELEKYKQEN